jgi:hypothetical protein
MQLAIVFRLKPVRGCRVIPCFSQGGWTPIASAKALGQVLQADAALEKAMDVSRQDFARVYRENCLALVGMEPDQAEIDLNYQYYLELVDLTGGDGELLFMVNDQRELTWDFAPRKLPSQFPVGSDSY